MRLTSILTTGTAMAASVVLLTGPALAQHISGTSADDHLQGTSQRDTIRAHQGDDVIAGRGGPDLLFGQAGDDLVRGGSDSSRDLLDGGPGDDRLLGGPGGDFFHGGAGDDVVRAGAGNDQLETIQGDDRVFMGAGNDELSFLTDDDSRAVIDCGSGHDVVNYLGADRHHRCHPCRLRGRQRQHVRLSVDGVRSMGSIDQERLASKLAAALSSVGSAGRSPGLADGAHAQSWPSRRSPASSMVPS